MCSNLVFLLGLYSLLPKFLLIVLGCIESLRNLLSDNDSTVRHKATEVLHIAASHNIGRNAFQDFNVIVPLSTVSIVFKIFIIVVIYSFILCFSFCPLLPPLCKTSTI